MANSEEPAFDRVLIIMFENMYRSYVMANDYMRGLAAQGIDLANSFGVMHPSQTNYIASIAGELCNVTDDDRPPSNGLPQRTIVDIIEESGGSATWKAYMDGFVPEMHPWQPDLAPNNRFPYVIKHNPFSSFSNILADRDRWQKIDSENGFFADVAAGTLPSYSWFTPNMWNDGHYSIGSQKEPHERAPFLVDQLARWLEYFFGVLKFPGPDSLLPKGTLVVVTFDESDFESDWDPSNLVKYTYDGPNQIYTVLLGDGIQPGVEEEGYNHYSLLKTVEKNYALAPLGKNDADSNWLQFLWGKRFRWDPPVETPIQGAEAIAAAEWDGALHVVYSAGQALYFRTWDGKIWGDEDQLSPHPAGGLALAACGEELILAYQTANGISTATYTSAAGWSESVGQPVTGAVGSFDLAAIDGGKCLMLAWADGVGQLHSLLYNSDDGWANDPTAVGFGTDGDLCLGVLGPSVYLIHKSVRTNGINVISYNTAPFNVVTHEVSKYSGPYDDTTIHSWSPSSFPVAHFSHAASHRTPGEDEPINEPYEGRPPLAAATLDGVIHLAHPGTGSDHVVEETFSLSGIMTPKLPVSYKKTDEKTTSNGYGTLAEAGWGLQSAIGGVSVTAGGILSSANFGSTLCLLSQHDPGEPLLLSIGSYQKKP